MQLQLNMKTPGGSVTWTNPVSLWKTHKSKQTIHTGKTIDQKVKAFIIYQIIVQDFSIVFFNRLYFLEQF